MADTEITAAPPIERKRGVNALFHARGMYLGYYMAIGAFIPFINLYYMRLGLSGEQIGVLAALPVLIASSTSMVWGGIADAFQMHRILLRVALLLVCLSMLALSLAESFPVLLVLVSVYALFFSPVLPLIDSAALEAAKKHLRSYGDLRVWGTIGWSISTWLIGGLIQNHGIRWMFYGYAAIMGLTLLLSLFQPPRQGRLEMSMRHGLGDLVTRPGLLVFLISTFLVGLTNSMVQQYQGIFLDRIGAGEGVIGLAASLAALSEIPVMFGSRAVMERIGARGLLMVGCATYALRWGMLSYVSAPAWALVLQLLHGLSFAAFLIGGVTYMYEHTPEGLGTTSQALFTSVAFGLASVTGSLMGGALYDRIGFPALFRLLSVIAAAGFILFYVTTRNHRKAELAVH